MSRFSGRRVTVGFKKEAVRGTKETSGFYYYPFLSASFNDKNDKKTNDSAYGSIVKSNDQITTLQSGEGDMEGKIFSQGIGYLLTMLFGAAPTTTTDVGGDTGANQHVFALANNNSHQSFTTQVIDPNTSLAFALSMLDSFKFTWVKDDFTKVAIQTLSKASSSGTGSATFLTSDDNEFLPKHLSLFLADDVSGLDAASEASSITSFSFEVKKNLTITQTTKSKDQVDDIHNVDFEISGSIEKYYEDTTYKGYDLNDTMKALRVKIEDSVNKAGTTTPTSLTFDFNKVAFSNYKPGYGNSDISTETFDFTGLLKIGDSAAMGATLVNKAASY